MKAILVNPTDRSLHWSEVPDPVLTEDEVLVKVSYAAINRADLMQRAGDYPPPPGAPEWMGLEVSGVVVSEHEPSQAGRFPRIGDQVCCLLGGGGYAEYVAVKRDMCMPIPQNMSLRDAAAMPEAFATAYLNLFREGKIEKGNTLLVTAGASGLASVIVPMAKAFGIRVLTTVRKSEQVAKIAHLGADRIIDTSRENLPDVLKEELEGGHPVDVAIDCLGGEVMGKCLPYLAKGARWIMIAALSGQLTEIDLKNIYVRNVRIIGSTLRSRDPKVKADILASLVSDVWGKVSSGEVRPTICAEFPIQEAEAAQAVLSNGQNVGKVVLKVFG